MLTQKSTTYKIYKITTRTITDSYKQLFVLITVLLTILTLQTTTTTILTMAAPLESHHTYRQHFLHTYHHQQQQQQQIQPRHTQLHQILLAERHRYDHDHDHDHDHDNYHRHHQHQTQQQQQQLKQVETDLNRNLKKSKANIIRYERSNNGDDDDEDRLRKREISWHEYYQRIMQSQAINWYNPCGGISLRNETPVKRKKPPPIKKELRKLQSTVAKNYSFIKNHLRTINIQDMHEMEYFEKKYTFLPKLNANSSIALRRWHRQLQIYVAAFEYLRRAELNFNNIKASQESTIAQELDELMKDARTILCNIEHAINNTTTRRGFSTIDALFISRTKMEGILNFTTDIKYVSPLRWNQIKDETTLKLVDPIDLKFAKSYYFGYVRRLLKILRTHTKQKGPMYLGKRANKGNKVQEEEQQAMEKTRKQPKQQRERKTQQKPQQQQPQPQQPQQKKRKNSQTMKIRHSSKKLESVLN